MTPEPESPWGWIEPALDERRRSGLLRVPQFRLTTPERDFASNDYLALRRDHRLFEAGSAAAAEEGGGAGSSPAVRGWSRAYDRLLHALADWKGAEAALAFSSGYVANLSTVAALVSAGDVVYADRLAHACLIDGARVSGALLRVFAHNDADKLAAVLARDEGRFRRRLIVTESLFSMDGDQAPLQAISELASKHRCMMLVDEAHATGVFGPEGRGLVEACALADHPSIVRMGTLSKAIGGQGGYVVGSESLISWLIQSGRGWIYSTAISPFQCGAAAEAIRLIQAEDWRRARLLASADRLRVMLRGDGWDVPEGSGPIVPVLIGEVSEVMRLGANLAEDGFAVGTIRPPTVPKGTARLRLSLTAAHGAEAVDRLVAAMNLARNRSRG